VRILPRFESLPDSLIAGLADREASIWVSGAVDNADEIDALAAMLRLPWKHVFIEEASPLLVAALEMPESDSLVRRRGFIHIVDTDPSRINLPTRALPIFLLSGRNSQGSLFELQLRRMTMLDELRRSSVRQLVVVGGSTGAAPSALDAIWATGFRTRLLVVNQNPDAIHELGEWLDTNGDGPAASIICLPVTAFATDLVNAFTSSYSEEEVTVRQRDEAGNIRHIDLTDIDDPERPILDSYDLIQERDFVTAGLYDLPEEAFNAFFRGEIGDWRAFAAGLPWIRDDSAWRGLQAQLRKLDSTGSSENRVTYIVSESGAGGTTFARHLAFSAARAGYPTLVAKGIPFTPDALPLVNFLTHSRFRSEDLKAGGMSTNLAGNEGEGRLYETPWLLVFDRIHWELRGAELRRFLQQFKQSGRPVCILVVTGPQRDLAFFDESRFKPLAELGHMLDDTQAAEMGQHLNRFLRVYGKERPEWQWRNFQQAHSVRYLDGAAAFWITLTFWLQSQYDLSDSIQSWVYRCFKAHADTPEVKRAILQIAALSSERLPMPESLIEQGGSAWPVPLLLDDRRSDLSPLGLTRLSHAGKKYWALAHDILGHLLINALFYDYEARSSLGFADCKDAQHLRFTILKEVSRKPALGEAEELEYGEEFATTVFKIDPDHGRSSWIHIWREVLDALDGMPAALRNGSRVFRHHTGVSRRRIAWLDEAGYGVSDSDRVILLQRAIDDINYALQSIAVTPGDEPDVYLYNSLANAYFDLARVRAGQGAPVSELADLRRLASEATRHAYEQNPSSPYVIETHVKSLIASAEQSKEAALAYCIEALEIVYATISRDRNELRRHSLATLADRAVEVLMASSVGDFNRDEPSSPAEVLVRAWVALSEPSGGHAPESLEEVPGKVLTAVLEGLDHPAAAGNSQIEKLRYQILVASDPYGFERQLQTLDLLVATDYRLSPQLRLEHALLLFQQMRADEANQQFKTLRALWRETDISAQVPENLRWLVLADPDQPRVVTAVSAYDNGHRAMARVREFGRFDVPYRPQEWGVRVHRAGTTFSAHVSFGHNGPFLRPVNAPRH